MTKKHQTSTNPLECGVMRTEQILVKDVLDQLSLSDNEKRELVEKVATEMRERLEKELALSARLGNGQWQSTFPPNTVDYRTITITCA